MAPEDVHILGLGTWVCGTLHDRRGFVDVIKGADLDYLGGSSLIKSLEQRPPDWVREVQWEGSTPWLTLKTEGGSLSWEMQGPLGDGNGLQMPASRKMGRQSYSEELNSDNTLKEQEMGPQEPPEKGAACPHLDLSPGRPEPAS